MGVQDSPIEQTFQIIDQYPAGFSRVIGSARHLSRRARRQRRCKIHHHSHRPPQAAATSRPR
jgi:hypothetical protein